MEKTMSTTIGHYFKHLTCTLFVVLGLGLLAPGTHAATVVMSTVSLTSPAAGATFTRDQTVTITASAASSIGVKKVQFFDGATWIATDTTAPYSFPWAITAANNGSHSLTAKVYDAAGKTKVSAASVVTVNIPVPDLTAPTISLTSPATGTTLTSAQTVTIAASATDNIGVSKVELYDGATLIATDSTSPYSFAWAITSANNGSHSFSAKAYDAAGNSKISAATAVTVNIAPPVVATPGSFEFAVGAYTVNESGGKVDVVIKRVGGSTGAVTVGFRTGLISAKNGYDYVGIPLATQSFASGVTQKIISVGIMDDTVIEPTETFKVLLSAPTGGATLGATTESIITVLDNDTVKADATAPTVSLSSPTTGTTFTSTQTVTITAAAADNIGVSKVELYDGATLKGTDTTAPYSFAWAITSANNGSHNLTAKAYDAAGNSKVSTTAAVTVNIAPLVVAKPGSFEFAVGAYTARENDGQVDVIINRVGGSDGQVSVDFRTGLVTAVNGEDYVGVNAKAVTFNAGETWKTERVSIINDSIKENEETFKVILSNPTSGATIGAVSESIITVLDDDAATTTPPVISGPVKAFPGAEGFGAITKGGRGGKIVKVTNLNDSGAGSLREALYYTTGPRIVVFEVAGVINLNSVLVIREPYVTIAGQTAPAPGITLGGYGLRIYTHDVVLQHLFVRPNPTFTAGGGDGIAIKNSSPDIPYNIVLDHCSVSWANDENVSVFPGYGNQVDENITISNSLIAEGHYGFLLGQSSTKVSAIRNIVMSSVERHPRIAGGTYLNIVNNLLYNAQGTTFTVIGDGTEGPDMVSIVGNSYINGPSSNTLSQGVAVQLTASPGTQVYAPVTGEHANIASNSVTRTSDTKFIVNTPPVPLDGITVFPTYQLESYLTSNVGARPAERGTAYGDTADERFISEIRTRTGKVINRVMPSWTKPVATTRSFNSYLPANPSADDDGDGYTNIEEVLHQMATEVEKK